MQMLHITLMTVISENIGQTLDQANASLHLTQKHHSRIAAQASTIKISSDFLTGNTCKRQGDLCIFVYGSFLSKVCVVCFYSHEIIQVLKKGYCPL